MYTMSTGAGSGCWVFNGGVHWYYEPRWFSSCCCYLATLVYFSSSVVKEKWNVTLEMVSLGGYFTCLRVQLHILIVVYNYGIMGTRLDF